MKKTGIWLPILILPLILGCGTPKHIDRDRGLFAPFPEFGRHATINDGTKYDFPGKLKLLYERKIKGSVDSPAITENGLIAFNSSRQRFLGFDQSSGKRVWQIKERWGFMYDPAVVDSMIILIKKSTYGEIRVTNLFSGDLMAKRTINEIRTGPIIVNGGAVFGTVDGLMALELPDLETTWRTETDNMIDIRPVADSRRIYLVDGKSLRAVGRKNGEPLWRSDLKSAVVSELSIGRYLYVGLVDGAIVAVDTDKGKIVWEYHHGFRYHGRVFEFGERLYVGATDGGIYCLSAESGEIIWSYQTDGVVTATPVVYGEAVLVGSQDRYFYSLDWMTGELIDRYRLEGRVTFPAAIDGGRIFVTCRKNRLYCFEGQE